MKHISTKTTRCCSATHWTLLAHTVSRARRRLACKQTHRGVYWEDTRMSCWHQELAGQRSRRRDVVVWLLYWRVSVFLPVCSGRPGSGSLFWAFKRRLAAFTTAACCSTCLCGSWNLTAASSCQRFTDFLSAPAASSARLGLKLCIQLCIKGWFCLIVWRHVKRRFSAAGAP